MRNRSKTLTRLTPLLCLMVILGYAFPSFCEDNWLPPDLTVTKVKFKRSGPFSCEIESITIKNIGNGPVGRDKVYRAFIRVSTSAGTRDMPMRLLIEKYDEFFNPGNSGELHPPAEIKRVPNGKSTVLRVEIDPTHVTNDANRQNNTFTKTFKCPLLPDLAVTRIYTKSRSDGSCEIWAEVRNLGKGEIPPIAFKESYMGLTIGHDSYTKSLSYFDKSKRLAKPNGTIHVKFPQGTIKPLARVKATAFVTMPRSDIEYVMDPRPSNNSLTVTVFCPGTRINTEDAKVRARVPSSSKIPKSFNSISPPPIPRKGPITR